MRPQELEQHFAQELERLYKVSSTSSRPRPSRSTLPPTHPQDHPHSPMLHAPSAADGTPQGRWETYKRIKANRQVTHSLFPRFNRSWRQKVARLFSPSKPSPKISGYSYLRQENSPSFSRSESAVINRRSHVISDPQTYTEGVSRFSITRENDASFSTSQSIAKSSFHGLSFREKGEEGN